MEKYLIWFEIYYPYTTEYKNLSSLSVFEVEHKMSDSDSHSKPYDSTYKINLQMWNLVLKIGVTALKEANDQMEKRWGYANFRAKIDRIKGWENLLVCIAEH